MLDGSLFVEKMNILRLDGRDLNVKMLMRGCKFE